MASCADYVSLWPTDQQQIAVAVCLAESSDNLGARCLNCAGVPEDSNCWWQVNTNAHPQYSPDQLRTDPAYCAQAAFQVWQGQGWDAWSTYTSGAYLRHMDDAAAMLGGASQGPAPGANGAQAADVGGPSTLGGVPTPLVIGGAVVLALWAIGEL